MRSPATYLREMEREEAVELLKLEAAVGIVLLALIYAVVGVAQFHEAPAKPAPFIAEAKDRPVLETVEQVRDARMYGAAAFYDDGIYTVVVNMPEEYIDYSSCYVRMP